MREKTENRKLFAALVFLAATLCFLPSLSNMFVDWDDLPMIVANDNFRGFGLSRIKWMFTTFYMAHYHPLTWISYAADYKLFGLAPAGYHFTSVFIHSLNALLVYLIFVKIFGFTVNKESRPYKYIYAGALAGALFFALSPLRVESVTWVSERKDVLCAFFYLLSFYFYLERSTKNKKRYYYCSLLSFLAACFSKSMAVTLPAALLLADVFILKKLPPDISGWADKEKRKCLAEKIPFFTVSAVFVAVLYLGTLRHDAAVYPPSYLPGLSKAVYAYAFYIYKTFIPLGLAPLYPFPEGGFAKYDIIYGSALIFTAFFCYINRKKYPALQGCALYYFITLLPVCGLLNGAPQPAADRYSYLPLLSLALLAGYAFISAAASEKRIIRGAAVSTAAGIIGWNALLCVGQQEVWHDTVSLWTHTVELYPDISIAHNNLAAELLTAGDKKKAFEEFEKAISCEPDNFNLYSKFGYALFQSGEYGQALKMFLHSFEKDRRNSNISKKIAETYDRLGESGEAERYYRITYTLIPDDVDTLYNLAASCVRKNEPAEALAFAEKAMEKNINKKDDEIYAVNCAANAIAGNYEKAMTQCRTALKLNPGQKNAPDILKQLEAAGKSEKEK